MEAMETLTKADLSRYLMERLELGKKDADLLVNTFLESIIESLKTAKAWNCAVSAASGCGTGVPGRGGIHAAGKASRSRPSGWCTSNWARNFAASSSTIESLFIDRRFSHASSHVARFPLGRARGCCARLCAEEASKEDKAKLPRIAILDFKAAPDAWHGWRFGGWGNQMGTISNQLRDLFTTEIVDKGKNKFRVIERERLQDIRAELNFQQSGEVDTATVQKIGKLLGAKYVMTGKVTRFAYKEAGFSSGWGWAPWWAR